MVTGALFALFLVYPTVRLLLKSILSENGMTMEFYHSVLTQKGFLKALGNSFLIAGVSALLTTGLAFFLAYTIHYTNINAKFKKGIEKAAVLPMFLPTLTYGFAIIYSFGKQGFLTKLFGRQLFDIYGFNGLLIGYIIYTLPVSFLLIHNTMGYIDKKFMIVSRIMGDNRARRLAGLFRISTPNRANRWHAKAAPWRKVPWEEASRIRPETRRSLVTFFSSSSADLPSNEDFLGVKIQHF